MSGNESGNDDGKNTKIADEKEGSESHGNEILDEKTPGNESGNEKSEDSMRPSDC